MGVSFYTVRVVLDTLGEVDYGIYNVVGGIVIMFSFMSNTMATASQRFFATELGRGDSLKLKQTFSMTMQIYLLLSVLILILAESVGLWFLNTQMTIPAERMGAARWIYQFSVFSFIITMFTTPYNAIIIAHERMNIYAWVSIVEVILKLVIVYLLLLFSYDKLKLYAVLVFVVTIITTLIYRIYSRRKFKECSYSYYWEKSLFTEIVSYSGWNLFGALAGVFNGQGINIILNMFFGPIVNTARAIAFQVSGAINQFVLNFMTASRPQITKYYAIGERERMLKLVFQSSKFSFLLLFLIAIPLLLETEFIFNIWLKEVPDSAVLFTRLVIITALIDSLSYPLMTAAQATGRIKKYQATVGTIMLLSLPLSYLFLKMGFPASIVFYIAIFNAIVCLFARLLMLKTMVELSISQYIFTVLLPVTIVTILTYPVPVYLLLKMDYSLFRFLIVISVSIVLASLSIYWLGLSRSERAYGINVLRKTRRK